MLATASQPEPSAKAPCTRTTFLICCFTIILLCSKDPLGPIYFRCRTPSHQTALVLRAGVHLTRRKHALAFLDNHRRMHSIEENSPTKDDTSRRRRRPRWPSERRKVVFLNRSSLSPDSKSALRVMRPS